MELCELKTIRPLLERHGFRFSKALGQNFLIADWVPRDIAAGSGADAGSGVLEIGPGIGCLTQELAAFAGHVTAVELDDRLIPVLAETVGGLDNVDIVHVDVMVLDLPSLVREKFPGLHPMVCANLPYNITSPVLTMLLESGLFTSITVMIQREVARRICARPGTADYGAFTLLAEYYAETRTLFDVPPSCFVPQPKVTSSVIRMDLRSAPPVDTDPALLFRVIRACFVQRRKTLSNGLAAAFPLPKASLEELIASCGFDACVRGETLDLASFARLADAIGEALA